MWSMHQQETSSMGHAILEAGMPPFFLNWGKNLKYGESPPNGAVTGSKWVGVKQQKSGKYSKLEELHEA